MSTFGITGRPSYRTNNALGFFICAAILAFANLYIEPVISLDNCALCTLVRLILLVMAGLFMLGFLFNSSTLLQRLFSVLNFSLIITGIATVILNLTNATKNDLQASCKQDPVALFDSLPFQDALVTTLGNASNCPDLQWNFSGLSFAHISLATFMVLFIVVWKLVTKKQRRNLF
ncbi:MAG: disulfide bond formation protein B [Amphritea sp.]